MTAAKVVNIQAQRAVQIPLDQLAGFEGVKLLSDMIQKWHRQSGGKVQDLARKANLTPTTVSRIMSRETKSPRMLTCIMLFKALGFSAIRLE